ncbi:hypothetical protein GCM10027047_38440 [Rhodococcus aerolatus]
MTDAPLGPRLLARLLDVALGLALTLVLAVPLTVVYLVAAAVVGPSAGLRDALAGLAYLVGFVLLEWVALVRRGGQSVGKGLLGLAVVTDRAGTALPPGQALGRVAVLFAPFVLIVVARDGAGTLVEVLAVVGAFATVGSLLLAALPGHRALHDRAALSRVVPAGRRAVSLRADLALLRPR